MFPYDPVNNDYACKINVKEKGNVARTLCSRDLCSPSGGRYGGEYVQIIHDVLHAFTSCFSTSTTNSSGAFAEADPILAVEAKHKAATARPTPIQNPILYCS